MSTGRGALGAFMHGGSSRLLRFGCQAHGVIGPRVGTRLDAASGPLGPSLYFPKDSRGDRPRFGAATKKYIKRVVVVTLSVIRFVCIAHCALRRNLKRNCRCTALKLVDDDNGSEFRVGRLGNSARYPHYGVSGVGTRVWAREGRPSVTTKCV